MGYLGARLPYPTYIHVLRAHRVRWVRDRPVHTTGVSASGQVAVNAGPGTCTQHLPADNRVSRCLDLTGIRPYSPASLPPCHEAWGTRVQSRARSTARGHWSCTTAARPGSPLEAHPVNAWSWDCTNHGAGNNRLSPLLVNSQADDGRVSGSHQTRVLGVHLPCCPRGGGALRGVTSNAFTPYCPGYLSVSVRARSDSNRRTLD